jgi:hypothetical protein
MKSSTEVSMDLSWKKALIAAKNDTVMGVSEYTSTSGQFQRTRTETGINSDDT